MAIKKEENATRANRNIPGTKIVFANSLNLVDILSFRYLLLMKDSIAMMSDTYTSNKK